MTTTLMTFKYELVSSGGVKRKIGEGEERHTIPVQGSCTEHAEAVKLFPVMPRV